MYSKSIMKKTENSEDNWRSTSMKRERGERWEFPVLGKGKAFKEPELPTSSPGKTEHYAFFSFLSTHRGLSNKPSTFFNSHKVARVSPSRNNRTSSRCCTCHGC